MLRQGGRLGRDAHVVVPEVSNRRKLLISLISATEKEVRLTCACIGMVQYTLTFQRARIARLVAQATRTGSEGQWQVTKWCLTIRTRL